MAEKYINHLTSLYKNWLKWQCIVTLTPKFRYDDMTSNEIFQSATSPESNMLAHCIFSIIHGCNQIDTKICTFDLIVQKKPLLKNYRFRLLFVIVKMRLTHLSILNVKCVANLFLYFHDCSWLKYEEEINVLWRKICSCSPPTTNRNEILFVSQLPFFRFHFLVFWEDYRKSAGFVFLKNKEPRCSK